MRRPQVSRMQPLRDAPTFAETEDVAEYIAKMTADLARLAGAARLTTLTFLLDMARIEAESHLPRFSSPPN